MAINLCNPSPCGPNSVCDNGICTCLPEYNGDPYFGCRPECIISSECPMNKACVRQRCINPCDNTCGTNARCEVVNHMAMCTCPPNLTGNAFVQCNPIKGKFTFVVQYIAYSLSLDFFVKVILFESLKRKLTLEKNILT